MAFVFDPDKDDANLATHGLSLARASDFQIEAFVIDDRKDYGETRFRAFGLLDDQPSCLVFTMRADDVRVISLRRAHAKEYRRHVAQT
ncbi:MAG: BrnT family toxin [Caulobacter sp.]|nr:BrnT family toxin [Caulobacter sp.]